VVRSELAHLRKATRMRTAVRRWLAVQLSPRRRASKPRRPPCQPRHRRTHTQRSESLHRGRLSALLYWESTPRKIKIEPKLRKTTAPSEHMTANFTHCTFGFEAVRSHARRLCGGPRTRGTRLTTGLRAVHHLPPSAAFCAALCAASFTCPSFTCRLRAAWGAAYVCWAWVPPLGDGNERRAPR